MTTPRRVAVIGAGLSGLLAARELRSDGFDVVVVDKGRGVGGRLATRRVEAGGLAVFDHGAQFFTVRSDEFDSVVREWIAAGVASEWCRGFDSDDGHPRYFGPGGMTTIAKYLAAGLDVRLQTLVFAVRRGKARAWDVVLDDASVIEADAVVVTCPLPQSYSLLVTAEVELSPALMMTDYERTLGLLAILDRPTRIGRVGGQQNPDAVFSWIGDNQAKGISPIPAVTCHASPEWSLAHWDDDRDVLHALLCDSALVHFGDARIVTSEVKRWRFATPTSIWPDPCFVPSDTSHAPIVLAGDAFAGPKIEGAALSGLAAADAVARLLAPN